MNELKHHGILGMRWGIRRYQNEDGSLTALGRKRRGIEKKKGGSPPPNAPNNPQNNSGQNQNQNQARITVTSREAHQRTNPSRLSNEELQARIQRIQLENQYKQLTKREASAGEKFVGDIVGTTLKGVATKRLTKFLNDKLDEAITNRAAEKNMFENMGRSAAEYARETSDWDRRMSKAGEYAFKFGAAAVNAAGSGLGSMISRGAASGVSPTESYGSDFVQALFAAPVNQLMLPPGRR